MAVDCSWADAEFRNVLELPSELKSMILESTGGAYLEALAAASRLPQYTDALFVLYEPLFPELVARWVDSALSNNNVLDYISVLSSLARIIPFAPYLRFQINSFAHRANLSRTLFTPQIASLPTESLIVLLTGLFRLLSHNRDALTDFASPVFFSAFLHHASFPVRYLAAQCMCFVMHFADAFSEKLVHEHAGQHADEQFHSGLWEGQTINYSLLKLFEERRWTRIDMRLKGFKATYGQRPEAGSLTTPPRFVLEADLSPNTASISGVLVPRDGRLFVPQTSFAATTTASSNLIKLGRELLEQKPILLTGQPGSGKTSLVMEAARLLNKLSSMITLHLNEQTDAKSLLGLYTSSTSGSSFVWQPGVLTKAIQQGRWVLIEDIDRAPAEVLGVLRPIIENGELFLPSRKEKVRPRDGFRIIATVRTSGAGNRISNRHAWLSNTRLWSTVEVASYSMEEIDTLLRARYPGVGSFVQEILTAHGNVSNAYQQDPTFRTVQGRLPSLRDLLKWCRRICRRARSYGLDLARDSVPETFKIEVFKDGVDCYAAHLNDNLIYNRCAECIAQAMNVSAEQMRFCLHDVTAIVQETQDSLKVGRSTLRKTRLMRKRDAERSAFAFTSQSRKTMESVAAGIDFAEPFLLVGETGVGKTTTVQHMAKVIGKTLTVVNLSQQSEATDLLGGLKPVTTRSLLNPLRETFDTLFDETFSARKNDKFTKHVSRAYQKQNWQRLLLLWQEGAQNALDYFEKVQATPLANGTSSHPTKKRKLSPQLVDQWKTFKGDIQHMRSQVDRGDKSHVFAFVEGRLIQAVRNGEWILLDEINLASADTLDHIVDLLHDGDDMLPSILLSEAGSVEKVTAHPEFRIFAAMNPATDAGKKDLAPAIRSRFTELYVQPGDQSTKDLVQIIQTHLGELLDFDKRVALDLAHAYLRVKELNDEQKLTDGAGDIPHFSIRSLVRCLMYVRQHTVSHGLRRALYEGFAMSFFTVLSRESEKMTLSTIQSHLLSNTKNVKSFLAQQPKLPSDRDRYVTFRHHLVQKGFESPDAQPDYIITPSVERNLLNLARAASMRRFPILLQGPTSAGKTSMVEYLAKVSGNKFVRVNNHEHTDLQEYLGSYASGQDGQLEYREGVLVEALRKGHWIVLDELNLAPSDVLEALNRLLDDNRELFIPETQEAVKPHENFMLFATQNPAGLYGGRKRLSRAFRNRFLELHFDDIPEDELEVILQQRARIPPSYCTLIVSVYKKLSLQRQSTRLFEQRNSFATLRDLFRWAGRRAESREQLARDGFMLLAERVRDPIEREVVRKTIQETVRVKLDDEVLYGISLFHGLPTTSDIVWTKAMRRLFILVSEALKKNEPVLLVGETGCGKTQICQTVAHSFAKHLNIYNAHTNTETGDLIGSQRPIRQRSELANNLTECFKNMTGPVVDDVEVADLSVNNLIERFATMDTSTFVPDLVARTRNAIGAYQSLFAWIDGSLVSAMKAGEHFLLDEISLADDSVLERLNSLLEPARTIVLAEKGPTDNEVTANLGFQFLATMNPGGDYGKRELSAALRNRLTEIWVPSLSEDDDILPIIQATLGSKNAALARIMLDFARWFKNTFSGSDDSAVSLRSLLAWAQFFGTCTSLDPEIALVHGAAMVYIDSLGANPAGMTASSAGDVEGGRQQCLQYLQQLLGSDVSAIYLERPTVLVTDHQVSVGAFALTKSAELPQTQSELVFEAPTTAKNTMRIIRALQMTRPILLEGSPGVGKTAIVTALAQALGKPLTRINLSDQTDLMDLFGADAPSDNESFGRFAWRDGPLLQAMQSGGWVLLDEMNLASQSVLEGLNSCLDHRHEVYIAELDKSFVCHPNFTLFAAQNPHHQGGGRKGLPKSFINRFTVVYADPFLEEDILQICSSRYATLPKHQLEKVVQVATQTQELLSRSVLFDQGGPWEFNLRDVYRWLDLCAQYPSLDAMYHFDTVVVQRLRSDSQKAQTSQLCIGQDENFRSESLYHNLSALLYQVGIASLPRDVLRQSAKSASPTFPVEQLPQVKAVMIALAQNWPIVLAGPSGCGKTTLIRNLAAFSGAILNEIALNADTDTMDLLGGFEQYDFQRDVAALVKDVARMLEKYIGSGLLTQQTTLLSAMLETWHTCQKAQPQVRNIRDAVIDFSDHFSEFVGYARQLSMLVEAQNLAESRFVWNDGVLIDAMREGSWIVLDNANLCNPSVLDRLNSLLETNGHLVVSEQHNAEEGARVIKPHPSFRIFLTMDPRYGELSRAMRNRSLEVYMQMNDNGRAQPSGISYPTSSDISRLRHLEHADLANVAQNSFPMEPLMQHMSLKDLNMLTQLKTDTADSGVQTAIEARVPDHLRRHVSDFYVGATRHLQQFTPEDQPHLPLLNEPLLRIVKTARNRAEVLTRAYLLNINLTSLSVQLQLLSGLPIKSKEVRKSAALLQKFGKTIRDKISKAPSQDLSNVGDIFRPATTIVEFTKDYINAAVSSGSFVNQGGLQAYLKLGQQLVAGLGISNKDFSHILLDALQLFQQDYALKTGLSLQRMWASWKPVTASSQAQLERQFAWEALLETFDELSGTLALPKATLAAVRTRLCRAYASVFSEDSTPEQFQMLSDAVNDLACKSKPRVHFPGHFAAPFSSIIAALVLEGENYNANNKLQLLSLFSGLPLPIRIAHTDICPASSPLELLATVQQYGALSAKTHSEYTTSDIVGRLIRTTEQPLGSLDYAQEELLEMTSIFSASSSKIFASFTGKVRISVEALLRSIVYCHFDCLTKEAAGCLEPDCILNVPMLAAMEAPQVVRSGREHQYLRDVFERYLLPAARSLVDASYAQEEAVGIALVRVAMAALVLLVPDRPFDPALYPTLVAERHQQKIAELGARTEAQQRFQKYFTGQDTSMLIRMLQRDLQELGNVPDAPKVARPTKPELGQLQDEFTILLHSIIEPQHEKTLVSVERGRRGGEAIKLAANAERLTERLVRVNRYYDDLVKPVVWLLKALALGAQIFGSCAVRADRYHDNVVIKHIPLLGAKTLQEIQWPLSKLRDQDLTHEVAFGWLEHVGLQKVVRKGVESKDSVANIRDILEVTDNFYQEWKSNLTKDQAEAESRSKYYAYRGGDDNADDAEDNEMDEIFPSYEEDASTTKDETSAAYNARDMAVKLASVHDKIFSTDSQLKLRQHMLLALTTPSSHVGHGSSSNLPSIDQYPGVMMLMEEKLAEIGGKQISRALNIYTDGDIGESKKLVKLVQNAQDRFQEIEARWPEHAVPAEVLACCDELLRFKLNDPIAKLMTKTEKLHEAISQWQSVASREWSAASHLEEVTALIISWRRLELSSWSRLLDVEKEKQDESAKAWYFIAYEAVIHNSRQIVKNQDDVPRYCLELAKTFEEFLSNTTMGEYAPRLRLLDVLCRTLEAASRNDGRLLPIHRCINSVLLHYQRYKVDVAKALETGRADLEKAVKEQILLASWKDTNVTALRDSAKKSHNKLFRTVKKYRTLLGRQVSGLKAADTVVAEKIPIMTDFLLEPKTDSERLDAAIESCSISFPDWETRPQRLVHPLGATTSMRRLYLNHRGRLNVVAELASFRDDLVTSIKELRSETPSTLTEENGALVRHLRERKRRLLADTMKTIAHMGIRRNLAVTELGKQASTSAVLAVSADIESSDKLTQAAIANGAFHDFLDCMPQVRTALVDHSDDLAEGESRRAVGMLEGFLSLLMDQRSSTNSAGRHLQALRESVSLLQNVVNPPDGSLGQIPSCIGNNSTDLVLSISWLPHILEASCQILRFQSQQAQIDFGALIAGLEKYHGRFTFLAREIGSAPRLPHGLSTTTSTEHLRSADQAIEGLGALLQEWSDSEPEVSYLLRQLIPWTQQLQMEAKASNGIIHHNIAEVDNSVRQLADQVFVALQDLAAVKVLPPATVEDPQWLVAHGRHAGKSFRALHVSGIAMALSGTLDKLGHLDPSNLQVALSLFRVSAPIFEQFGLISQHIYEGLVASHIEACRLAITLARSFSAVAKEGFCSPTEPSKGEEKSGNLEAGTGLGEGEGAEDISKDVGEDEDLADLAQTADAEKRDGEMEASKDAVDMGADDLQGETREDDEVEDGEEDADKQSGDEEDEDKEEEAGSVDDLDPSAVDEKMWDDIKNEGDKEMKGDKEKGQKSDEQAAAEEGQKAEEGELEAQEEQDEMQQEEEGDEGEAVGRPEAEKVDPHLEEENALELPEELQLTGEEEGKDGDVSDDGMDDLSDVQEPKEDVEPEQVTEPEDKVGEDDNAQQNKEDDIEDEAEGAEQLEDGVANEDEIMEDQPEEQEQDKEDHTAREDEMQYDVDEEAGGESGAANQLQENLDQDEDQEGKNQAETSTAEQQQQAGQAPENQQEGETGTGTVERGAGRDHNMQRQQSEALKKLADVLDQWHQRREILPASEHKMEEKMDQDIDMADADFEHVEDEKESDAQALGAAAADQTQNLDESKAIEDDNVEIDEETRLPDVAETQDKQEESIADRFSRLQAQAKPDQKPGDGAFIPSQDQRTRPDEHINDEAMAEEMTDDIDHLSMTQQGVLDPLTADLDAARMWSECSTNVHGLSLLLTEQLRLILHPTTATKLRGDFRTGKRLNLKRIIPYIASGYKRDKIWMRRSIPSKRNYQIMIAVDDSQSMSEGGADLVACSTLAMLCKSLSMLEAGDICVVGFGEEEHVRVAHPFGQPFSNEAGSQVFQHFSFTQKGTDVRKLIKESIDIFADARLKASSSQADLWQLQLIISDGQCSDHDDIRRLVRKAQEEKIMIVFVVVDSVNVGMGGDGSRQNERDEKRSILEQKQAVLEKDEASGEMRVKLKRYLEGFPFPYYVVVRDVKDLPFVLASALKGWFGAVVDV